MSSGLSRRRIIALGAAVAVCAGAGLVILDRRATPILVAGPMVQMPAADAITVVWEMRSSWSGGEVRFWTGAGGPQTVEASRSGKRCEATIRGLPPGARVTYTVTGRGLFGRSVELARNIATRTAARRGEPFRFVAFGDSGSGNNSQAVIAELIAASRPDVVIHVGDLIYPAGATEDYLRKFFEPNEAFISTAPFMPALGNHDCATDAGRPLLKTFVLPENGPEGVEKERCYWFDYGDARFAAVDSNPAESKFGVMTPAQFRDAVAPWLRRAFGASDARWKIAYWHHPYYTNSTHLPEEAAALKAAIAPIIEETGVDLVFCGHNHLYERTAPMRADRVMPEGQGVVYITTGAGGATRYAIGEKPQECIRVAYDQRYSFSQVEVTPTRLELKQIDERGTVIDAYVIEKPGDGPA